ncbi:uncharacterized protein LOC131634523 isoform X2 [Vicia villosa]|uniref:uncharacterized protein LOC131634523 isoform X2 n=1 Tax=Vicia villosa TaxID=3911 RepID=UPI00273ACC15|nr:uncharacterized protein LOC131634523 isoform X2 [Vicia villosa]
MASSSPSSGKRPKSEAESDEENKKEQDDCCGICYAERGVSVPGEIDSCNHYFCFVCIMEWAKHESRCPICRQRFSIVRRLPKLGVFSSSRDVKVPLRDQVYHPHGNMTSGPVGSNAELKCCVCLVAKDENLIIICDLCDMASHTYCVGLGYSVPEGDWFCHDCAVSRETNANDGLDLDQQTVELTAEPGVTVLDIVRETGSHVARRPMISSIRQNNSLSTAIPLVDRVNRSEGKKPVTNEQRAQCNVQALRENWNSLRSGSLKFDRKSFQSGGTSSQKHDSSSLSRGGSHSIASTGRQQSTVQGAQSSNMGNDGDLKYDVHKAWQMMDRAKTVKQTPRRTSRITQVVDDDPSCSGAKEKSFAPRSCLELKNLQPRTLDFRCTRMEEQCGYSSLTKKLENHLSPLLGEKRKSRVLCEEKIQHLKDHTSTSHSVRCRERPLLGKAHTGTHSAPRDDDRNSAREQGQSAYLVTSVVGSASSSGKSDSLCASNKDVDIFNKEKRFKGFGNEITKNTEDAKTEIQSLVKLNLKCLTRDKQLGVETFKGVARKATHTILAACHSEQHKSNICSSSSVCSHTDHITQFQQSTLMPNCCRQCFQVYVNDVVKSIMLEKGLRQPHC